MKKHTPGPWIADVHLAVRYGARSYVPVLRPGNDPVPVAAVHLDVDRFGRDEGEANARLIAAAPDMLAALRDILAKQDKSFHNPADLLIEAIEIARAAIGKAERPPLPPHERGP